MLPNFVAAPVFAGNSVVLHLLTNNNTRDCLWPEKCNAFIHPSHVPLNMPQIIFLLLYFTSVSFKSFTKFIIWLLPISSSVDGASVATVQKEFDMTLLCTGLFKMIVGVLTTYHTQYTWDKSICIFYLIEQHSTFLLHTLQVLYICALCDSTNINTIIEFVPNCP